MTKIHLSRHWVNLCAGRWSHLLQKRYKFAHYSLIACHSITNIIQKLFGTRRCGLFQTWTRVAFILGTTLSTLPKQFICTGCLRIRLDRLLWSLKKIMLLWCPRQMVLVPVLARPDLIITRNVEWANLAFGFEQVPFVSCCVCHRLFTFVNAFLSCALLTFSCCTMCRSEEQQLNVLHANFF